MTILERFLVACVATVGVLFAYALVIAGDREAEVERLAEMLREARRGGGGGGGDHADGS